MAVKKRAKAKAKAGGKSTAKKTAAAKKTKAAKKKPAKKKTTKATKRKAGAAKAARAAKRRTRPRKSTASAARPRRSRKAAAPAKRRPARKAAAAAKRRRPARRVVFESELAIGPQRKGLAAAAEPSVNRDPANFVAAFRAKLEAVMAELAAKGMPFKLVEGFRTKERQQWLFGSGRPTAVPFGRTGPVVTRLDGVTVLSRHQGNGNPGSGRAADCYPTKNGKVFIPKADDPVWKAYADAAVKQGLVAGLNFPKLVDAPHVELPP